MSVKDSDKLKTENPNREKKPETPAAEDKISQKSKYFPPKGDNSKKLPKSFYDQPGKDFAKALLGKTLVRILDGERMSAKIVETEAYLGLVDKAAHSYSGKRTNKTEAMFCPPGTAYVYNIYGVYCCMNISCQGEGCATLIRAAEPLEGKNKMSALRWKKDSKDENNSSTDGAPASKVPKKLTKKNKDMSNGPSKLCQALGISKSLINLQDMTQSDIIWLEDGDAVPDSDIVVSKRINIGYAEEWTDELLRFYILNNDFVSDRDKLAERQLTEKYKK